MPIERVLVLRVSQLRKDLFLQAIGGSLTFLPVVLIVNRGALSVSLGVLYGVILTRLSRSIVGAVIALSSAVAIAGILVSALYVFSNAVVPGDLVLWTITGLGPVVAWLLGRSKLLPPGAQPTVLLGVAASALVQQLPWTSIDGLSEVIKRGGDGASFLRNFAMGLTETSTNYVLRQSMGHTGGGVLATFISWFQNATSLSVSESVSFVYQPMLMWRLYWLVIYCTIIVGAVIAVSILSDLPRVVQHLSIGLSSVFTLAFSLAFIRPGLFTAVLAVFLLTLALMFAICRSPENSSIGIILSVTLLIGATQSWMPFSAHGFVALCALTYLAVKQRIKDVRSMSQLQLVAALVLLAFTGIGLIVWTSPLSRVLKDFGHLEMLFGTGGGDAPASLHFVLSIVVLVILFEPLDQGKTILTRWSVVLVAAIVLTTAIVMAAAFLLPPYWLEYGPKKFFMMTSAALLPVSIASTLRRSMKQRRPYAALLAVASLVMWAAISTEPLHQFAQVVAPNAPRSFIQGLHTAVSQFPDKRVVCIDTAVDGNGYDAYDCSEFALGIRGLEAEHRLFMTGNLCLNSPEEYLPFDKKYYRDLVIVVSDGTRLSSTTGCQEKYWESDGRPPNKRWLLGWVTLIRWSEATVLDFDGKSVTPSFSYLQDHPEYSVSEIKYLQSRLDAGAG